MRCKHRPAKRSSGIYHNHIDATFISARVSVDVLENFVAEFLWDVEESGRVSLSPSRDPLEAFGISLEREIDSVGLVKVEGGLFDATKLDS
jgi:hypothetical protein